VARRQPDPKAAALRDQGCLHPHPEQVTDDHFASSEFFDARDLVQVKYEMLRRVHVDGRSVSDSAARCRKRMGPIARESDILLDVEASTNPDILARAGPPPGPMLFT